MTWVNDDGEDRGFETDLSGDDEGGGGFLDFDTGGGDDGGEPSAEELAAGTETPSGGEEVEGSQAPSPPAGAGAGDQPPPGHQPPAASQPPLGQAPEGGQQTAPTGPQTQVPGGQQPSQPQQPADFEKFVSDNAEQIIKQLAEGPFQLTREEVEAMGEGAAKHVPPLLARSHVMGMVQVARALQQTLPVTVANLVDVTLRSRDWENKFYNDYPALKSVPRDQLASLAYTLRQSNPNVKGDDFMGMLARTAAAMTGAQLPPRRGAPAPHQPANAAGRGTPAPRGQSTERVSSEPIAALNNFLLQGTDDE